MLQEATLTTARLGAYERGRGSQGSLRELQAAARPLRGLRVLHVSATGYGGGVAEMLRSSLPLLRRLGITADWKLLCGDEAFFAVTKKLHNGLQGAPLELSRAERQTYLSESARNARLLAADSADYDIIVVHDPQPLALLDFHGRGGCRWVWRCHLDTSRPHPPTWEFVRRHLAAYDAAVFTLPGFVPPDMPIARIAIVPPAIDPATPKNVELPRHTARRVLHWLGIDADRPVVTQVSRFDPWKDPLGVIRAYRLVKRERPGLQLALVGSMALDDPEGWTIHREIAAAAACDPDLHVLTNLNGAGNIEVNALQRLSRVVVQKSLREGFGLTVAEALWKGTPVVASRTGGIPLQMPPGVGGFLVDSVEACAEAIARLLRHPLEAEQLGARGREHVRARFLLPRLIEDELRLYAAVLGRRPFEGGGRPDAPLPEAGVARAEPFLVVGAMAGG